MPDPLRGAGPDVRAAITATIEDLRPRLVDLSHRLYANPEVGFLEHGSVAAVATFLASYGYDAKIGEDGLPTSLRAVAGHGRPRVAVLAEYDALPGVGHGCGHNVICASALGAFLGLARHVSQVGGSVALIGTPAEENGAGKEVMARAGAFDDVDAVVMLHPFTGPREVAGFVSLAVRDVEVTYHGTAAHASSAPHLGRNALDAVVAAYQGIASVRQHMGSTDRLHAIITDGGSATNVVPDRASAVVEIRSRDLDALVDLSARVQAVLEAAALMTGTRLEARWDPFPPYLPVRSNDALARLYHGHMCARGRSIDLSTSEPVGGGWSTDLGNLSVRVPAIHPTLSISAEATPMHTVAFGDHSVSATGDAALVDGAVGLALTMADYLADAEVRRVAHEDFEAGGGLVDVEQTVAAPRSATATGRG
ncbi:M20 family metallopeptidase [Nocardioides sp. AN3]